MGFCAAPTNCRARVIPGRRQDLHWGPDPPPCISLQCTSPHLASGDLTPQISALSARFNQVVGRVQEDAEALVLAIVVVAEEIPSYETFLRLHLYSDQNEQ
jgi:hypothetical protein